MTDAARTEPPLDQPAEMRAEARIDPARIEAFVRRSLRDAAGPVSVWLADLHAAAVDEGRLDRLGAEP